MNDVARKIQSLDPKQSDAFRDSFERIIEWMRYRIFSERNINRLLAIAQFYGTLRLLNFDGVYQDNEIEDMIEERVVLSGKLTLSDMSKTNSTTVLIASNLVSYGGHSRVVLNWLTAFEEEDSHKLLITQTVSEAIKSKLEFQSVPFRLCAKQGIELINEIVAYCANVKQVVLLIDPSDIAATIAARILAKSGKHIIFYNHADHRFSFGICSAHLVCEISQYGIELNRRARPLQAFCYLGIPIDFRGYQICKEVTEESKLAKTVLSSGGSYKYAPGTVFFGRFIDELLEQRSDVSFMIVGPTGNEPWWVKVRERWCDRVHFADLMSQDKYFDIMKKADVYVDSFPVTGGTAFPEALLNGKAVAGMHGALEGYSPADELRAGDIHTLTRQVIALLDGDPISVRRIEEIRIRAAEIHSITQFRERVENIYFGYYDRNTGHKVDVDTYWLENRWAQNAEIYLPGRILPTMVPLKFGVSFKFRINRLLGPLVKKYRGYILLGIIFRLLPANAREFAKNRLKNTLLNLVSY
jgi:glycosyltransferase involved in cell wall biosynthesis